MIGVGVHIYVYIRFWTKKNLKCTLAFDSPFQIFMVGPVVEFIRCALHKSIPN